MKYQLIENENIIASDMNYETMTLLLKSLMDNDDLCHSSITILKINKNEMKLNNNLFRSEECKIETPKIMVEEKSNTICEKRKSETTDDIMSLFE